MDVVFSPRGAVLAERRYAQVGRSLAPLTSELSPADQRRVQTLLEQMLGPQEPPPLP